MCKAVHFAPVESTTFTTLNPSFKMSQSEKSDTWYQRSELETFRTNAKAICRSTIRKRKLSSISNDNGFSNNVTSINVKNELDQDDADTCTRGLELATDEERKKRKHCANKIIVTAQKSMKAKELATISSKLSSWARDNSIKDARFDLLAVCLMHLS